jgi:hypothetical protein
VNAVTRRQLHHARGHDRNLRETLLPLCRRISVLRRGDGGRCGPARNETGQRILKFRISGNFFWAGLQNDFNVICPVQSPRLKIFRLTRRANHRYDSRRLTRTRGVAHVTNARWDAVDATASGAQMESQGGSARERSAGARTNDAATRLRGTLPDRTRSSEDFGGDGRGRRSRVVLAPRRWR